jgi:endonuclease III
VQQAIPIGKASAKSLFTAHLLLQKHGREICRRSVPECGRCQLQQMCAYGLRVTQLKL